ncbi:MAG: hypothetical protein V3V96_14695 [Acidiferrobacterales bacterium]
MPDVTASLDPQTEELREILRRYEARHGSGQPASEDQVGALADTSQEIDIASTALNDDLFVDAPTPVARLKRLNQIRRSAGLMELLTLPAELESSGFVANLKNMLPKALTALDPLLQTAEAGLGTTSVGLAQLILRGKQPVEPPQGAGFRILSNIISIAADPITYASGGVGGVAAKSVALKAGTGLAGRVAARGAAGATTLAGLTAVRDPLGQQATTGQIDPVQTAVETGKAAVLGATAIGAGAIGGRVVGTALEVGTFANVGAALEGRLATADDWIESAGVIGGLKAVGVVQRTLGKALFKQSRGEQLTPEEQQTLDQTPQTVKERVALEVKAKTEATPATSEQTFTKQTLLSREGAAEFATRHPDVAKVLIATPTASRKNFRPLKQLLPDVDLNASERNQFRANLHEVAGKPVVAVEKTGAVEGAEEAGQVKASKAGTAAAPAPALMSREAFTENHFVRGRQKGMPELGLAQPLTIDFEGGQGQQYGKGGELLIFRRQDMPDPANRFSDQRVPEGVKPIARIPNPKEALVTDLFQAFQESQQAKVAAVSRETLTAEPLPEPGRKLDKLQETVVENVQGKATAETPPETVPVVPVEEVVRSKLRGINPVKRMYRWLRTGGQHDDVVKTSIEAERLHASYLRQMRFEIDDYHRGLRREYGPLRRVPPEELARINAVLLGEASPEVLPEAVRGPVVRFRNTVDSLTTAMIRDGVVQGEMGAIFTENLGTYLHRSYKIFRTDPKKVRKFINRLSPEVRQNAIALFRAELEESLGRSPTPAESDAYLNAFLHTAAQRGSPAEAHVGARLGVKELGILKQKKDIHPALRALMGEDVNPRTIYANTVASQAQLLASATQLSKLRDSGLGTWLFEQPQGEFFAKIDDAVGERLYPLTQGKPLYTTPEYERALRRAFTPTESTNPFVRTYFWFNAAVKAGLTAGSVMGIQRNFLSNPMIALANGHLNPWQMAKAVRTTGTDILPSVFSFLKLSNRAQQEQVVKLIDLGVINAASRSGELRAIFKDAARESGPSGYIENTALRALTLTPRKFFDFFRGGDDFYHTNGFYHELADAKRLFPDTPLAGLERMAADKVIKTYPTYSQAPHAVQALRKAVVVGDFATFPAEMVRTTINIPRLVAEEMADPRTKAKGIRRGIGFAAMAATATGIATATRQLTNVSPEEEEAMRELAPEWMQNSQWAHLGKDDKGRRQTIDTQYNVPQGFMVNPIIAALRGDDLQASAEGALREMLRPFFNEAILFGVARDIFSNQRISQNSNAPIYNDQAPPLDITRDIAEYITSKMQPGTIRSIQRIVKGVQQKPLKSGRVPNTEDEIFATLMGIRLFTHDTPISLGFQSKTLMQDQRTARGIFFNAAYARDGRDPVEVQDAFGKAIDAEREIFAKRHTKIRAAKTLGMTDLEIESVLNDKRVAIPKGDIRRLFEGDFDEDGILKNMVWSLSSREFDERIPSIFKALGVSPGEAEDLLREEMRDRQLKTVPILRIARLRQRIK